MKRIYKYAAKIEQMASDKEVAMIMSLTGVDEETATRAYLNSECMEEAIDLLLPKPSVSGDKYILAKPKINTGLTPEQEALCKRGRWLQDQVNVVFSVAHSKTRTPQDLSAPEGEQGPQVVDQASVPMAQRTDSGEGQQDSPAKTTLLTPQSESLHETD